MTTGSAGLPPPARRWLVAVLAAGAAVAVLAAVSAAPALRAEPARAAGILALMTAAILGAQSFPLRLPWRGQHIAIRPDEAAVLVAFVLAPGPGVILAAGLATLLDQARRRQRPAKLAFNVAVALLAVGLGVALVTLLQLGGVALHAAALALPLAEAATGQAAVALMATLASGRAARATLRNELAKSIVLAAVVGSALGYLTLTLARVHPLAAGGAVFAGILAHRAMAQEYRHQGELAARRALTRATERVVGEESEDAIVAAVFDACDEAFLLHELRVRLDEAGREWVLASPNPPSGRAHALRAPLHAADGRALGELELRVAAVDRRAADDERGLVDLFARYLALAFSAAEAQRRRREAEARAREAAARNERLVSLTTLVEGIAHEFNNPVMYIQGNLDLSLDALRAGPLSPEDLEAVCNDLETALRGAKRLTQLTHGLSLVSKRPSRPRRALPLEEVVAEAAASLRVVTPGNVRVHVEAAPGCIVVGDRSELVQSLASLARNAVEAVAPKGGDVTLGCRAVAGSVEAFVVDDGPGIAPDARARLFTPFFTTKVDGTGLSLAIVHGIAQRHGAVVDVDSTPGKGARFAMRFPSAG